MGDDYGITLLLLVAMLCGLAGAGIGSARGNSKIGFCLGLLLGPLGWIITLLLENKSGKLCPECKGRIPADARRCQHCSFQLQPVPRIKPATVRLPRFATPGFTKTSCPHCSQHIEVPQELSESELTCPTCQKVF
jgi:hypothetical protein